MCLAYCKLKYEGSAMNLTERKRRLKMFFELEQDKEMIKALIVFMDRAEEIQELESPEEAIEIFKNHFAFLLDDENRKQRLFYCNGLLKTFMEATFLQDGLSQDEVAEHIREVLHEIAAGLG